MGTFKTGGLARKKALQEENTQITLCTGVESCTTKGWKKFSYYQCNKDFQYVQDWNIGKDSVLGSIPHEH